MLRLFIVLLLVLAAPVRAETRDPATHFFQQHFGDFKAELETARQQGKQGIFLFFEMDECPFCARMKSSVLNQVDVQEAYRERFLNYTVDVNGDTAMVDFDGKETTEKDFALAHRVRATPTLLFFDRQGKLVARFTGPTKDKAEFLLLGRYVSEGAYATRTFSQYKQGK